MCAADAAGDGHREVAGVTPHDTERTARTAGALTLRGLRVTVGQFALTVEDLCLPTGLILLAGPNGAGKTTLLRTIAGILPAPRGTLAFGGQALRREQVSLLPQRPTLPLDLTPTEVLEYMLWLQGTQRRAAHERSLDALRDVGLLDAAQKPVRALSGGMARRLAIACAVVSAPDVLLLDEPTNDLDPVQKASVLDMIEELARDRVVIVSSHALHDLADRSDRIVILNGGHILADGDLASLRRAAGQPDSADLEEIYLRTLLADSRSA